MSKTFTNFSRGILGPFSRDVYDDLTFFILRDFIQSSTTGEEVLSESAAEWDNWIVSSGVYSEYYEVREYEEESFSLTKKGCDFISEYYEVLSESQKRLLREFKVRTSTVPLRGLLRFVYKKYPQMTTKSKLRNV